MIELIMEVRMNDKEGLMNDEDWKNQYKGWKVLKPFQVKLLDEGAQSLSQAWLINAMWCEWKDIKKLKEAELPSFKHSSSKDPWEEE